mgnify:CR=1 FL=1
MRPIHEMLLQAQGHARFHMPGHKGALDPFDMTELPSTDDLYHPQGAIRRSAGSPKQRARETPSCSPAGRPPATLRCCCTLPRATAPSAWSAPRT